MIASCSWALLRVQKSLTMIFGADSSFKMRGAAENQGLNFFDTGRLSGYVVFFLLLSNT